MPLGLSNKFDRIGCSIWLVISISKHCIMHTSHHLQNYCKEPSSFNFSILRLFLNLLQVVEDGYEFFAKRRLVTIFSAPNYGGEFDNAGALLSVDESLVCSFEILKPQNTRASSSGSTLVKLKKVNALLYTFLPFSIILK